MKRLFIIFVILAQMSVSQICFAAGSFSETFNLSVTIPAIIGLNVPDPEAVVLNLDTNASIKDLVNSNTETQVIEMTTVRDHQNIFLRTLVVR